MRSSLGWLLFGLTVAAPARAQSVPETKYDIVGIKVGMPIKEALAALKVHNPNLRLQPESLQYGSLPNALTYAISAEGASEVFYFLVTMPPNPIVVSKITWTAKFTVENPPKQDELVATLAKKYGPITWDTLPASLTLGSRELVWADDAQGKRLKGELPSRCRGLTTFFANGPAPNSRTQYGPTNLQISPAMARIRVEEGYANKREMAADACGDYTMVRARLFKMKAWGVGVPNLVSYLTVMIGSGPLDRSATNATHQYVTKSSRITAPSARGSATASKPQP